MTIIVASGTSTPTSTTVVPDQHVELAVAEPRHLGVAVGRLHPAVDEADPERREQLAQADRLALGRDGALGLDARLVDERHDDERPVAGGRLLADLLPRAVEVVRAADPGPDRDAAGRRRAQVRDVEVGVEHLAERPRDRRRGHQQDVRRPAAGLGLERVALADAEPVLLVDDDEAEVAERDGLLDQRVRADHDGRLPERDVVERLRPARPP